LSLDLLAPEFSRGIIEIEDDGALVEFLEEEIVSLDDGYLCEVDSERVRLRYEKRQND